MRALVTDAVRIMGPRHPRVLEYGATLNRWSDFTSPDRAGNDVEDELWNP